MWLFKIYTDYLEFGSHSNTPLMAPPVREQAEGGAHMVGKGSLNEELSQFGFTTQPGKEQL